MTADPDRPAPVPVVLELADGGAVVLEPDALIELADAADAAGFAILADALTNTANALRLELAFRADVDRLP